MKLIPALTALAITVAPRIGMADTDKYTYKEYRSLYEAVTIPLDTCIHNRAPESFGCEMIRDQFEQCLRDGDGIRHCHKEGIAALQQLSKDENNTPLPFFSPSVGRGSVQQRIEGGALPPGVRANTLRR